MLKFRSIFFYKHISCFYDISRSTIFYFPWNTFLGWPLCRRMLCRTWFLMLDSRSFLETPHLTYVCQHFTFKSTPTDKSRKILVCCTCRSERMQMTDWAFWKYISHFSYTILMHGPFIFILFLLKPTNAKIYATIFSFYIMLNPTCLDVSVSFSGSSKTCTTLIYMNY